VNFKQLSEQLRREARSNPKKAAVLGLLLLVAGYFWAPLVFGWFRKNPTEAPPEMIAAASAKLPGASPTNVSPSTASPVPLASARRPGVPWRTLIEWIDRDPKMKPWIAASGQRNPFAPPVDPARAREVEQNNPDQEPPPQLTPEQLGLQLTGVMIAGRQREAIIGQQIVREGDWIERSAGSDSSSTPSAAPSDDAAKVVVTPIRFRIVEIHARQVVLIGNGTRYMLSMPEDRLADARHNFIQVIPSGSSPTDPQ